MEEVVYDELLGTYICAGKELEGIPVVNVETNEVEGVEGQDYLIEQDKEKIVAIEKSIKSFKNQIKVLEEQETKFKEQLLTVMQQKGIDKVDLGGILITRKKGYVKHSLDSARLKEEMPDIAKMYDKETEVKESIMIKLRGEENNVGI